MVVNEIRQSELLAAQADVTGRCDVCGEPKGKAWMDYAWVCDECAALYEHKLDGEAELYPARDRSRIRGIGGSDIGTLTGHNEWEDPFSLALRLRGELEPEPPTERMELGKFLEQGIANYYAHKTGRLVRWHNQTLRHKHFPEFVYTPDCIAFRERRGVECKFIQIDQAHRWGPASSQIPKQYQLQVQWYMELSGFEDWDVAALVGSELRIYPFERDRDLGRALLRIAGEFWKRCVIRGELPVIGISAASGRYLKQRFPRNKTPLRPATEAEQRALEVYAEIREEHEEAERARMQLEAELKHAVGDADGIESDRYRFTYKSPKDRIVCDWQRLSEKLMENLPESTKTVLIAEHTTKEPGTRRMHWHEKKA